jgi:hypothetical protein
VFYVVYSSPKLFTRAHILYTHNSYAFPDRDESARLRAQQDAEYLESQLADRAESERREREERERQEEEERRIQEEELQAAMAMSTKLSAQDRVRRRKNNLPPEPAEGLVAATIRFQLPQGKKLVRRFNKTDSAQVSCLFFGSFCFVANIIDYYVLLKEYTRLSSGLLL